VRGSAIARGLRAAALAGAALSGGLAVAATIRTLDISRDHGRYELTADTFMDAPAEGIFDVLTDYDHFDRISSIYKDSGYLDPDADGTPIVFTRVEGCVLFYCHKMRRVERLEATEPSYIRTVTLPEQSDFKYATSEWKLEPEGDGTRVVYKLVMEPDFWVPPVVGPWYLKRTLLQGGTRAITRIERLANGLPANADDE
jgi:Polyketide cyclase / dehydrase and lipid transport